ncbi:MAG: histidinol-phosphate transaminase [Dehalococcoidia bacterium]
MQEEELRVLGFDPVKVIDLSANLHPDGPDPAVVAAARSIRFDRYPPPHALPLRDAIARASKVDPGMVLVTPGATAAIHLVARAFLGPSDAAVILGPTFGEYRPAIEAAGARAIEATARPPAFQPRLDAPEVDTAAMVFLCQPNNPTGAYAARPEVERLTETHEGERLTVVDAAYNDFVEDAWDPDDLVREGRPIVVIHSLTKLHAIPGLRLGYVVGAPELVARLAALQPSWSVDAASLAAGLVATEQRQARIAALAKTWRLRERLRRACKARGFEVAPGRANFLLIRTGEAASTRRTLLDHGFLARDCASFGLPEWVRVAIPPIEHGDALEAALAALPTPARRGRR